MLWVPFALMHKEHRLALWVLLFRKSVFLCTHFFLLF